MLFLGWNRLCRHTAFAAAATAAVKPERDKTTTTTLQNQNDVSINSARVEGIDLKQDLGRMSAQQRAQVFKRLVSTGVSGLRSIFRELGCGPGDVWYVL